MLQGLCSFLSHAKVKQHFYPLTAWSSLKEEHFPYLVLMAVLWYIWQDVPATRNNTSFMFPKICLLALRLTKTYWSQQTLFVASSEFESPHFFHLHMQAEGFFRNLDIESYFVVESHSFLEVFPYHLLFIKCLLKELTDSIKCKQYMFEPSYDKIKLKAQQKNNCFNKCSFSKVSSLKCVPVGVKSVLVMFWEN